MDSNNSLSNLGNEIWQKLKSEPKFIQNWFPESMPVWEEFVKDWPAILERFQNQALQMWVEPTIYYQVKWAILQAILDQKIVERALSSVPNNRFLLVSKQGIINFANFSANNWIDLAKSSGILEGKYARMNLMRPLIFYSVEKIEPKFAEKLATRQVTVAELLVNCPYQLITTG